MSYTSILFIISIINLTHISNPIYELLLIPFFFFFIYEKKIKIVIKKSELFFVFFVFLLIFISLYKNNFAIDLITSFHFPFVLLMTIPIVDRKFKLSSLIKIIKTITVFHLILYLFSFFNNKIYNLIFIERGNDFRFTGIFNEPAWLGFTLVFFMIVLSINYRNNLFFIILNMFFCIISFSGTAYALLIFYLFVFYFYKLNKKGKLIFVPSFFLSIILFYTIKTQLVKKFVLSRAINLVQGSADGSAVYRFLAPIQIIKQTINENLFTGIGIGNIENYIVDNITKLNYFILWNGSIKTDVNNIYAIVFTIGGIFLFILFISLIISYYKNYTTQQTKIIFLYLLIFPFFSGKLIHTYFWILFYFIKNVYYVHYK